MSDTHDDSMDKQPGAPSQKPKSESPSGFPPQNINTIASFEGLLDSEATVIASSSFLPPSDQQGSSVTTGTDSGTGSRSKSSSWSRPEQWLDEEGRPIEVGAVIKDRFELIEFIGEGGMGVVFKALDRRKVEAQDRDPYLAIKILNAQFKRHPESLKALQRESRKAQDLAHPNIVTVFDFDREGSTVFMTMEYMDGDSLRDIIRKNPLGLPVAQVLPIIEGMCQGLSYAHAKGIIHSDFKPGNVFITRSGLIKIFDFGIARAAKVTQTGKTEEGDKTLFDASCLGALTPAYASPEMFMGEDPDPRDDIFALACISYELFSGRHPFDKKRADLARNEGMRPLRLGQLNRPQWKGMSKGLAFQRAARTASTLHFLRDIKRKKSKLPFIAGSSILAMMFLALVLNKQITNGYNQYKIYSLRNRINALLASETNDHLTVSLVNLEKAQEFNKKVFFLNDFKSVIVDDYFRRAAKFIESDHKNYREAIKLLTSALSFYAEDQETVSRINKQIDEYKTEESKLIVTLRDRFEKLIAEGRILPSPNEDTVFNVMESMVLIDPQDPLLTDSRLIDAYVREAGMSIGMEDLDRAKKLITTGLEISGSNAQLKELQDRLSIKLQQRAAKADIARLEAELGGKLKSVSSLKKLQNIGDELRRLKELSPEHPLLSQAEKMGLDILDRDLGRAIASNDWRAGDVLLNEVTSLNLFNKNALQSRFDQLTAARGRVESRVDELFDKANRAITAEKPDLAVPLIGEIKNMAPDDVRMPRLIEKFVQTTLQLANAARANQQWQTARGLLDMALKQDIHNTMKAYLLKEKEGVSLAEESYGQQVKLEEKKKIEQVEAQREKQREEEILSLHDQFDQEMTTFQPDEKSVNRVLTILDTLGIKNTEDPFIDKGRKKIEEKFVKAAVLLRDSGRFEQALSILRIGEKALPDSQELDGAEKDCLQKWDLAKAKEQVSRLASLYEKADSLIRSAMLTQDWEAKVQKTLDDISSLETTGHNVKLSGLRKKISILYLNQAKKFQAEQQFTKAYESLDKGERYERGSEEIVKQRQMVADDEKAFREKALSQQRQAEIEGLKQSIRTYAQANEVDRARSALSKLKNKLSADDPFFAREAPKLIAAAYLRLAEKRAGMKDNRENLATAIELAKSGLALDGNSSGLQNAVDSYAKILEKLERQPIPPPSSGPGKSADLDKTTRENEEKKEIAETRRKQDEADRRARELQEAIRKLPGNKQETVTVAGKEKVDEALSHEKTSEKEALEKQAKELVQGVARNPQSAVVQDERFPLPGTRYVQRIVSDQGTSNKSFTVLEDGVFENKKVHRVQKQENGAMELYDSVSENWMAELQDGKVVEMAEPHNDMLRFPLSVGENHWAGFSRTHEGQTQTVGMWVSVVSFEKVTVPAGTFETYKILMERPRRNKSGLKFTRTFWYSPQLKIVVKRVDEPRNEAKITRELIEYKAP